MTNVRRIATVVALSLFACAPKDPQGAPASAGSATGSPTWTANVQPLVAAHCADCHVGAAAGGLSLAAYSADLATKTSSACAEMATAQAMATKVTAEWSATCKGSRMPLNGAQLSLDQQQVLRDWADAGAPE